MGIGLSLPGLVASKEGDSYTYLQTGLNEMPLQELLTLKFSKPVYIQNDVKSATLAEYRFGAAQGKKDALVLTLDWGIGLGVIMDGKLRIGTSGFAGEFGHVPFVDDGILCHCGKRGCLETVASGSALARMAREGMQSGQDTLLKELSGRELEKIEPHEVIEAANEGDQYAIQILAETGRNLGKGIAMLIQLFNPELIIIGGKMAEARQYITTPIQQSINTYCMTQLRERTVIALSKLGQEAGILGPVAAVMENIFENRIESIK
jgi:glucokinase-like ROK family protein